MRERERLSRSLGTPVSCNLATRCPFLVVAVMQVRKCRNRLHTHAFFSDQTYDLMISRWGGEWIIM